MAQYSRDEIKGFEEKDLRISKLAILKSLIEKLPEKEVYNTICVCELAEQYIDYVYEKKQVARSDKVATDIYGEKPPIDSWEQAAKMRHYVIPNETNIKVLNLFVDKYEKKFRTSVSKDAVLSHIIIGHGTYPTKSKSVELILSKINLKLGDKKDGNN